MTCIVNKARIFSEWRNGLQMNTANSIDQQIHTNEQEYNSDNFG